MKIEPVTLEGSFIRLEPLSFEHFNDLSEVAFDEDIWRWTLGKVSDEASLRGYLGEAIDGAKDGIYLPFATIEKASGKAIGATRFGSIVVDYRRVEIGWTWIARDFQRTFVNTEAKYLMLKHAFETWKCLRVMLQTDAFNERSQNAILRLGAKKEGILRRDKITDTGRVRDSVIFSIIDEEWETVKKNLEIKMEKK